MKKAFVALLLFFLSFANAQKVTNLYWEPEQPKVGDDIVVYAEIEGNVSNVKLKYCPIANGSCFYEYMTYKDGKWRLKIYAENATEVTDGKIEIAIVADGKVLKEDEIIVEEKSTPGFEIFIALIALFFIAKIKMKK
ncbi:MAG: hypothetical protein FE047_01835 [Thermoplasmata archaeon]|nr:MAG: hypothetical protein FE047_01835 [Thermoplasmata archaeon]